MLDRLKEAHYRRQHGRERANLILRVEREIADFPSKEATQEWTEWLWSLPPEAWLEAVALKRAQVELTTQRKVAVLAITRKNKLLHVLEHPEEFEGKVEMGRIAGESKAAVVEADRLKVDVRALERDVRARVLDFNERFGTPEQAQAARKSVTPEAILDRTADRWQAWLQTVPPERRDEARQIRALHADLGDMKKKLIQAVTEKNRLEIDGAEADYIHRARCLIKVLAEERDHLDAMYRSLALPLFEAVGEPDLMECVAE